jgi:hypothetical protein
MTGRRSQYVADFAPLQLSPVQQCFKHVSGLGWQSAEADLFLSPNDDPRFQAFWIYQPFHKANLIQESVQKEPSELRERFLAEVPPSVKVVSSFEITVGEFLLVIFDIAGQTTRDRPDRPSVQGFQQRSVRHKTRDSPVAVDERVNPN